MKSIVIKGKKLEVISETLIKGNKEETNTEMKERLNKGLPIPTYSYTAVKTRNQRSK